MKWNSLRILFPRYNQMCRAVNFTLLIQNGSEPFDFLNQLNLPILNALWRVTVGERFEYDNPRLISIVHRLTETFKRFAKPENVLVFAFPWITKIYPKFMDRDKTKK